MRLGTCIALELAVAAGAAFGVWFGVGRASELAGTYLGPPVAEAATVVPTALPRAELRVVHEPAPTSVFGATDAALLAPLGATRVTRIKANHGGTSLSLRLDFASGARAAFKPEQIHLQSDPRNEVAAFRIDRLLGLGRVPPAKLASIPLAELTAAIEPAYRRYMLSRLEEAVVHDGVVHGELSWWVPEIKHASISRERLDEPEGRELWTSYLQIGAQIPAEARPMVEQVATLVLFDVLIDNADRWSGNNTMTSPDGKTLYFMDNTLAFSIYKFGHRTPTGALRRISVFPRELVGKLRGLTLAALEAALAVGEESPLGPLLEPDEVRAILARRDNILKHIDGLIAEFGEDAVLALP